MLEQLVNEIKLGGTLETRTLAIRLGTSPQIIEAMLEHLERIGQIKTYANCGDSCQGCSLSEACVKPRQNTLRLWQSVTQL